MGNAPGFAPMGGFVQPGMMGMAPGMMTQGMQGVLEHPQRIDFIDLLLQGSFPICIKRFGLISILTCSQFAKPNHKTLQIRSISIHEHATWSSRRCSR